MIALAQPHTLVSRQPEFPVCPSFDFPRRAVKKGLSLSLLLEGPVAVLGAGKSGSAAASLLRRRGCPVTVFDEKDGERFDGDRAHRFPFVVVSPGFRNDHLWVEQAKMAGATLMSELDLAAHFWEGSIVAVTGTNGKTTLCEFLAYLLRRQGVDAAAVGNNGFAFSRLDELPNHRDAVAVVEVSSFQAGQSFFFQADSVLWTNFAPDHLDRYESLPEYFRAKAKVFDRLRTRRCWMGPDVLDYSRQLHQALPEFVQVVDEFGLRPGDMPQRGAFAQTPQSNNYALALAWAQEQGIPAVAVREAAESFASRQHRFERVGGRAGITFINDSKATNLHALRAALASATGPVRWIGGGQSKGEDLQDFAVALSDSRVVARYYIGETGRELAVLDSSEISRGHFAELTDAVQAAFDDAVPGDIVLLSPGFASFDQFEDYQARGRAFNQAVFALPDSAKNPLLKAVDKQC